jgi:hypothetical protein
MQQTWDHEVIETWSNTVEIVLFLTKFIVEGFVNLFTKCLWPLHESG